MFFATEGLTLELFIEEAEYIPELTEVPGIRLAVHDQQTMPFPEDDGLLIAPHRHTMLAIQKVAYSSHMAWYLNILNGVISSL